MSTATEQVLASIKTLSERQDKSDAWIKSLQETASKSGVDPAKMLTDMQKANGGVALFNGDGAAMPNFPWRGGKGCGMGEYALALANVSSPEASWETKQKANKYLESLGVQRMYEKGNTIQKAPLAEASGTTGGYTVPQQFSNQLLRLAIEEMVIRPRARIMPMESLTLDIPTLDHNTAYGAGNSPFLGGVIANWTAEVQTRIETEPQFKMTQLKAEELSLYAVASLTLLADNVVGLDSILTQLISSGIAWYQDYAFLQGNGVGKPLGLLNCAATIAVNRANANKFQFADMAAMLARFLYGSNSLRSGSAFWAVHPSVLSQLILMTDPSGRALWVPINQGAQEKIPESQGPWTVGYLAGLPVVLTEKLPALGTKGDVLLVDASKYLIGDRAEIQIDVSNHILFFKNQVAYRAILRVDGQPWLQGPVTLADGTFTVSPFIALN